MPEKTPMPAEIGVSGLRHHSGTLIEEFDPELRGRRGVEKFREMRDNSPPVGAALNAIETAVRGVPVEVKPFSSERADERRAEFVDSCVHDMSFSWPDTRSEHLTMVPYGFAFHEIVYKRRDGFNDRGTLSSKHRDGRIGWAKIPLRGHETIHKWDIDGSGGIRGAWQQAAPDYRTRYLPIAKSLLFRVSRERNNPEGRSLLRNAYWSWHNSKKLTETMLIGVLRDLTGFPVIKIPASLMAADASEPDKAAYGAWKKAARDIHIGEQAGLVVPSDLWGEGGQAAKYDIELLSSGGRRAFDLPAMVRMFDQWIAIVLLADLMMMGHDSVGSFALAKGKEGLLARALNAYLSIFDETYNQHAIPRLMRLNGWPAERCPRLKHKDINPRDLAAVADYLSKLSAAGLFAELDPNLEDHLREEAGLPKRPVVLGPDGKPAQKEAA